LDVLAEKWKNQERLVEVLACILKAKLKPWRGEAAETRTYQ
jgi:hypothetical protein